MRDSAAGRRKGAGLMLIRKMEVTAKLCILRRIPVHTGYFSVPFSCLYGNKPRITPRKAANKLSVEAVVTAISTLSENSSTLQILPTAESSSTVAHQYKPYLATL